MLNVIVRKIYTFYGEKKDLLQYNKFCYRYLYVKQVIIYLA